MLVSYFMKLISWNVNGINACYGHGLLDFIKKEDADIYCFQEIKSSEKKVPVQMKEFTGYYKYWLFAEKKGYSGLAVFSKIKPINVFYGLGDNNIDSEGRVLVLEFEKFFLLNVYFPHSGRELERLDFKLNFNDKLLKFCNKLEKKKPIVIGSDFNVAHKDIDLKNSKQNENNAGFTFQEREWFDKFLKKGYLDSFRILNSEAGNYTWWSWGHNARERNIGWRIDYFVISEVLKGRLNNAKILNHVFGSDHCPVSIELNF